jgi:hypothetical protein
MKLKILSYKRMGGDMRGEDRNETAVNPRAKEGASLLKGPACFSIFVDEIENGYLVKHRPGPGSYGPVVYGRTKREAWMIAHKMLEEQMDIDSSEESSSGE